MSDKSVVMIELNNVFAEVFNVIAKLNNVFAEVFNVIVKLNNVLPNQPQEKTANQ
ncbi:hypothetical protein [Sporosarcina beigongshangi]|uniref:hypothetical protein n=1 Tax=Sporosarcina beigongshangi TaxID=2782538 RepID=UPI00193AB533|nr:hypothetical protein [Sporosarcina beigongshangi]